MRVIGVTNHLIVGSIGNDPLILSIFDFECVDELLFESMRVFTDKVLRTLAEVRHALRMISAPLMLCESILILALLLAHLAVELVFSQHLSNFKIY